MISVDQRSRFLDLIFRRRIPHAGDSDAENVVAHFTAQRFEQRFQPIEALLSRGRADASEDCVVDPSRSVGNALAGHEIGQVVERAEFACSARVDGLRQSRQHRFDSWPVSRYRCCTIVLHDTHVQSSN
jgi:hypothetical protein